MRPDDFIQVQGPLFEAVQKGEVFADSKRFVDAVPKGDPQGIVYRGGDLRAFVEEHFWLPEEGVAGPKCETLHEYIEAMWPFLRREMKARSEFDTLISLPHPHIVPGGRFREIYYWDSYFVILALGGRWAEEMVENFAHLIQQYGFVPNGNRVYYLTRSQPPFFTLMADAVGKPYVEECRAEYAFWMRGEELGSIHARVVHYEGCLLNRYYDASDEPRPEGYREDLGKACRAVRAVCESGWDFSSRWGDEILDILPVDLNALLYLLEKKVAPERAKARAAAIEKHFWTGDFYGDVNWKKKEGTGRLSLAGLFPLFAGIASEERAKVVARTLEEKFLAPGGLRTTLGTGGQWDGPNGWAPLHYIACEGLKLYGYSELAGEIARRWKETCARGFRKTGTLLEKYNVEGGDIVDGEYTVQEGFGWTNAIMTLL